MSNLSDFLKQGAAGVVSVADSTAINIDVDENVSLANNLNVAGGIVEQGGVLKENLLTNSGFSAWSNSTIEAGTTLVDNGTDWSGATGSTPPTDWTVQTAGIFTITGSGESGNCISVEVNNTPAANPQIYQSFSTTIGSLYTASVWFKHGTGTSGSILVGSANGNGSYLNTGAITDAAWTEYSVTFIATTTTTYINLIAATGTQGQYELYDTVSCNEVTPGCIAADTLGPDGWYKDAALDIHREHSVSNTIDGSFYALKATPSSANDWILWPQGLGSKDFHLRRFEGRTVTMGAWVKTSTADHVSVAMYDGGSYPDDQSSRHTGGGDWEWLEATWTMASTETSIAFGFNFTQSSGVAYISQPMLVFGSSIGEGNYQPNLLDPPTEEGFKSLEKVHGKAYVWDKERGMVLETRPLPNLLTNSGFEIWSNSTLTQGSGSGRQTDFNGVNVADDDMASDDTADWTMSYGSLAFDTDHYEWTETAVGGIMYLPTRTYEKGKLYKVTATIKDGTASGETFKLWAQDGTAKTSYIITSTGSWVTHSFIFECTASTSSGNVGLISTVAWVGTNIEVKDFYCDEVTPGCVAADVLGPDGWSKIYSGTAADLYRSHSDGATESVAKQGSFYALKFVSTETAANHGVYWPKSGMHNEVSHLTKFAGRTVTFGAWVKADTIGIVTLGFNGSSTGTQVSSANTGTGWEWLEHTYTIATGDTYTRFPIYVNTTGKTVYISQPILVFGSSIGEGNYMKPFQEVIDLETGINGSLQGTTNSGDIGTSAMNIVAETSGKIGKGCRGFSAFIGVNDSGSLASPAASQLFLRDPNGLVVEGISVNGIANNAVVYKKADGVISNDEYKYSVSASGASTFNIPNFIFKKVNLR